MKKTKAMLLACMVIAASFSMTGISGGAEESLVITRDEIGNVDIVTEDPDSDLFDAFLYEDEFGASTGLGMGEHGEVTYRGAYVGRTRTYIVTDGNGLQWDYMKLPWMTSPSQWLSFKEIDPAAIGEHAGLGGMEHHAGYKEGYADWFEKYGSDARLYCLDFESWAYKQAGQLPRNMVQYQEGVLDAVYMVSETSGTACWNGKFTFVLQEDFNGSPYPAELWDDFQELKDIYEEWDTAYQNWMDSIDADSMTPAQLELSRKEAGVASDYEMLQTASDACKTILEKYGDIFENGRPGYWLREYKEVIHPVSSWITVGDIDRDGELTAMDASLLLEAAANCGIGNETGGLDEYVALDADLNADYALDSADAALLLAYVAELGAGSSISVEDFIMKYYEENA